MMERLQIRKVPEQIPGLPLETIITEGLAPMQMMSDQLVVTKEQVQVPPVAWYHQIREVVQHRVTLELHNPVIELEIVGVLAIDTQQGTLPIERIEAHLGQGQVHQ